MVFGSLSTMLTDEETETEQVELSPGADAGELRTLAVGAGTGELPVPVPGVSTVDPKPCVPELSGIVTVINKVAVWLGPSG